jgi:hypothetical protein
MCVHPLLWLLFGFNIHKWNPGFITCYSYDVIEKFVAIAQKYQSRRHSLRFMRTRERFMNPSCAKYVIAQSECDNIVEKNAWNLWKFTRKFWNFAAPSFTNCFVNTLIKIATHFRWPTTSFFTVNIFRPSLNILQHCLTVPSHFRQ